MKNEILFFTMTTYLFTGMTSANFQAKYSLNDNLNYQQYYVPDGGSERRASDIADVMKSDDKREIHNQYQRSYNSYGQINDVSHFGNSKNIEYDDQDKILIGNQWSQHNPFDQNLLINQNDMGATNSVTKNIGVPVPQSVPIQIPHPITVEIPQPYPVHYPVVKPFPIQVEKTIIVPVEKKIPYPIEKIIPVPIEKPIPIAVEKYIPVPVEKPYPIHIPVYKHIFYRYPRDDDQNQKMHNRSHSQSRKRRIYRHGRG